jgi:hypothetical protein
MWNNIIWNNHHGITFKHIPCSDRGIFHTPSSGIWCHDLAFTNPFHGGFIPYANRLFHKPKPHPPGFFHNSCGHNNTGWITSITLIGLFNNPSFQSLKHIGIKPLVHKMYRDTSLYPGRNSYIFKHTLCADSSIDQLLGKYNI